MSKRERTALLRQMLGDGKRYRAYRYRDIGPGADFGYHLPCMDRPVLPLMEYVKPWQKP